MKRLCRNITLLLLKPINTNYEWDATKQTEKQKNFRTE